MTPCLKQWAWSEGWEVNDIIFTDTLGDQTPTEAFSCLFVIFTSDKDYVCAKAPLLWLSLHFFFPFWLSRKFNSLLDTAQQWEKGICIDVWGISSKWSQNALMNIIYVCTQKSKIESFFFGIHFLTTVQWMCHSPDRPVQGARPFRRSLSTPKMQGRGLRWAKGKIRE